MIRLKTFVVIAVMLCFGINISAQQTAFEIAERMTRGINLGNTFDAENYEGGWAPAATEKTFDAYKEAGFSTVRIPITWHAFMSETDSTIRLSESAPYAIQPAFLSRIDEVVNWSLERGFVTIINIHHDHWLKSRHHFDDNKERFYALWEQLAEHYKDYPHDLLFEIVNEPHHSTNGEEDGVLQEQLDELNKSALAIIRKHNPTRVTIYTGGGWSSLADLEKTNPPSKKDKYLMATYHSYSPWPFAGEGKGSWGTKEDKEAMEQEFINLTAYSKKHNVPVFIGEFGADHTCEYNARMLHYASYVAFIQKYNVATTTWDDAGYRFKVYDRNTGVWDDTKDILINYGPISPNDIKLTINDGNVVVVEWKNRATDIKQITVEKREGRSGKFTAIGSVEPTESFADEAAKTDQTYYYYRVVNELNDGTKLISYPRRVYIP